MTYFVGNALPSLVAAIAYFILGAIWYMPQVFGKTWMQHTFGTTQMSSEQKKGMGMAMLGSFIAAAIGACILRNVLLIMGVDNAMDGARYALYLSIGFIIVVMFTDSLYSHKKLSLLAINAGYHTVGYVLMGAILGAWY